MKKVFIGAAWPYANSSLHLGHIAGLIGGDILARYYRQKGEDVLFVSGSDCYGTPITIEAENQGVYPSEIAEKYHQEFIETLIKELSFSYDLYSRTTSKTHAKIVQEVFSKLYKRGYIYPKTQELPYCKQCQKFLTDRYIEGECPICGSTHAHSDLCNKCGNLLDFQRLINPRCKICSAKPIRKKSEHFFLKLLAFTEELRQWIEKQVSWRKNAKSFSLGILQKGLRDRALTRDIEWGVKIPLSGYEKKRIYVWFDAVCGYLSASIEWAQLKGKPKKWEDFWKKQCHHYYVHGKDNILFHTIIWPAILLGYEGLNLPNQIVSSEYLTLEGKQFSKSRKWAIWLPEFLKKFSSESLRYYLITNGPETADVDFTWKDFQQKNNTELVGNFGNFIHRVLSFTYRQFNRKVPKIKFDSEGKHYLEKSKEIFNKVGLLIESAKFKEAIKLIFSLAEEGNRFIDHRSPWLELKKNRTKAGSDLGVCIQVINNLRILIRPFLPETSEKVGSILGESNTNWRSQSLSENQPLRAPKPLFQQLSDRVIEAEIKHLIKKGNWD